MGAYKNKGNGSWYVKFRYKDWKNETRWITKRGFSTKREAQAWETQFRARQAGNLEMPFRDFVKVYLEDIAPRIKESTLITKTSIIQQHIIPHFGKLRIQEIESTDVLKWQNELLAHRDPETRRPFSQSYLKTVHNQLSAIFNHAVRFYRLPLNPARQVGNMGRESDIEMKIWTREEYLLFAEAMMDEPLAYYLFEVLYWCGLREGEALALTPNDFDFKKNTISITKTYQVLHGQETITEPKTPQSKRTVTMPDFLADEMQDYFRMIYDLTPSQRVFPVSKHFLYRKIHAGARAQGLPEIRVHDLRHSHVSLLIDMGYSAVAIAKRMGHKSIDITYRYAHLFPSAQEEMAKRLNDLKERDEMSEKNLDREGRWRNKIVAFRLSPEENQRLDAQVKLSGLTKQDYITQCLLEHNVTIYGNPRVFKALRTQLNDLLHSLQGLDRIEEADDVTKDIMARLVRICEGMMRADQEGG